MTPAEISRRVVAERVDWVRLMVDEIQSLPLETLSAFSSDKKNVWAAESCLRRSLEALMDLGRHILSKGFAIGVTEYKQIAEELGKQGVLSEKDVDLLKTLAGYRNRMVHFYDEVTTEELYNICSQELSDVLAILDAYLSWLKANPDKVDETL